MSAVRVARKAAGQVVKTFLDKQGYRLIRNDRVLADVSDEFRRHYEACRPFTVTSAERMYALYAAVRYVIDANIAGDLVECGVWRGGSSMLMASAAHDLAITDRRLWLYDTFMGMSQPTAHDGVGTIKRWQEARRQDHNDWCYAPLDEVKMNMSRTGFPPDLVNFVVGPVEKTIPARVPSEISLLRLDTDWYESTRHELVHLYPRLSPGGVLIIDDYGHWEGARKAVDEYFKDHGPILLHRTDRTGRVAQKPFK